MHVRRAKDAVKYQAPGHHGVEAVRLQGLDAGGPDTCVVSVSVYRSGAWVDSLPTAAETIYVVLEGALVINPHSDVPVTLTRHDSVHLHEGETRAILNENEADAVLLVVLLPSAPERASDPDGI